MTVRQQFVQIRCGDIGEFKTARGCAYAQLINEHKMYGSVMRILPGVYARKQVDFDSLGEKEGGWFNTRKCPWLSRKRSNS